MIVKMKFKLGRIVSTPGAFEALGEAGENGLIYLARHVNGDWGEICEEDRIENEFSLDKHLRLMSVYKLKTGTTIWVITEADRSVTTFLLPDEY